MSPTLARLHPTHSMNHLETSHLNPDGRPDEPSRDFSPLLGSGKTSGQSCDQPASTLARTDPGTPRRAARARLHAPSRACAAARARLHGRGRVEREHERAGTAPVVVAVHPHVELGGEVAASGIESSGGWGTRHAACDCVTLREGGPRARDARSRAATRHHADTRVRTRAAMMALASRPRSRGCPQTRRRCPRQPHPAQGRRQHGVA